jgi:hypothetical protein
MTNLGWLVNHRFQSLAKREYDWVFVFDKDLAIVVGCLWRLLEGGRIRFTSEDNGHIFGLPSPIDAVVEVNNRLANASIDTVDLRPGTLDLELGFATGHEVQIIPNSSGYESWDLTCGTRRIIAVGGGDLSILEGQQAADGETQK